MSNFKDVSVVLKGVKKLIDRHVDYRLFHLNRVSSSIPLKPRQLPHFVVLCGFLWLSCLSFDMRTASSLNRA